MGGSVTINLGGGNDSLTVTSLAFGSSASFTVNDDVGGTDSIVIPAGGSLNTAGGNINLNAESIAVNANATVTTSGGNIFFTAASNLGTLVRRTRGRRLSWRAGQRQRAPL